MAKINKRKWKTSKGVEKTSWQIDYKDNSGKRVLKSNFKTRAEAEYAYRKILVDLDNGTYQQNKSKITIDKAFKSYMLYHAEIHCKKSTVQGYRSYFEHHLKPFFKSKKLNDIKVPDINRFVKQKIDEGLSAQTINHLLKLLEAIYNKMINDEIIAKNPVSKVKKLKMKRKPLTVLSIKEVNAILEAAKDFFPDFYPILFTAIFTGMRRGELVALTWDKINWQTRKITIDSNFTKGELTDPKTKNSNRRIDMSGKLVEILEEWQTRCPKSDKNLVFPNSLGNYLDADNMVKRQFNNVLILAGVNRIRWHDLRHTYVSLLISQNIPIKYIQQQVGHGSIQITMDVYRHIMPEVTQMSVYALDNILQN